MEPPERYTIHLLKGVPIRLPRKLMAYSIELALESHHVPAGIASFLFTTDEELRSLNKQYRAMDEATDVLTFPADATEFPGNRTIGDVAISVQYAERQAAARGWAVSTELTYLAIHGALHLAGLDDETDSDRANMMREMARVAEKVGLPIEPEWASILHEVAS